MTEPSNPVTYYRSARCFPCGWSGKAWGDNPESPAEPYLSDEVRGHLESERHRAMVAKSNEFRDRIGEPEWSVTPPGTLGR